MAEIYFCFSLSSSTAILSVRLSLKISNSSISIFVKSLILSVLVFHPYLTNHYGFFEFSKLHFLPSFLLTYFGIQQHFVDILFPLHRSPRDDQRVQKIENALESLFLTVAHFRSAEL